MEGLLLMASTSPSSHMRWPVSPAGLPSGYTTYWTPGKNVQQNHPDSRLMNK